MILVLTSEVGDYSHLKIIDWLNYRKANYFILSGESILRGQYQLSIENGDVICNDINLTKRVKTVFYRRWFTGDQIKIVEDKILNVAFNRNLVAEMLEIRNFLFSNLKNAIWFPNANNINVNKLSILEIAKEQGLCVPNFLVTNSLQNLKDFYIANNKKIITKAIGNFRKCMTEDNILINPIYTKVINEDIIASLPEKLYLSFFQQMIEKKFEYRILFFNDRCYCSAILSQENELTKFDSRMNADAIESKLVAIKIDFLLEKKIVQFMNAIGLNIGSLDFLHGIDDEIYFLEVNPVGQIGGYSERCLLNFEKEVVEHLILLDND